MSSDFVRALLTEQRRRLLASILGYIEKALTNQLSPAEMSVLRDNVRGAINNYHDCVLDCLKASVNDGSVFNEHALVLLTKINDQIRTMKAATTHL